MTLQIGAEQMTVAEKAQKPLMRLQLENVGIGATEFSRDLVEAFELSTEWGAVMLLDGLYLVNVCPRSND
jgi:hypothetical protein